MLHYHNFLFVSAWRLIKGGKEWEKTTRGWKSNERVRQERRENNHSCDNYWPCPWWTVPKSSQNAWEKQEDQGQAAAPTDRATSWGRAVGRAALAALKLNKYPVNQSREQPNNTILQNWASSFLLTQSEGLLSVFWSILSSCWIISYQMICADDPDLFRIKRRATCRRRFSAPEKCKWKNKYRQKSRTKWATQKKKKKISPDFKADACTPRNNLEKK